MRREQLRYHYAAFYCGSTLKSQGTVDGATIDEATGRTLDLLTAFAPVGRVILSLWSDRGEWSQRLFEFERTSKGES